MHYAVVAEDSIGENGSIKNLTNIINISDYEVWTKRTEIRNLDAPWTIEVVKIYLSNGKVQHNLVPIQLIGRTTMY